MSRVAGMLYGRSPWLAFRGMHVIVLCHCVLVLVGAAGSHSQVTECRCQTQWIVPAQDCKLQLCHKRASSIFIIAHIDTQANRHHP